MPLDDFSDQNVSARKFTLILETEDNKYVTLKNITNPYPYVETEIEEEPESFSSDKLITSFVISGISGTISDDNTVSLEVLCDAYLHALTPTITISADAIVSPESGVVQDFTNPVIYTVTAQDESTRVYTVTVTLVEVPFNPETCGDGVCDICDGETEENCSDCQ